MHTTSRSIIFFSLTLFFSSVHGMEIYDQQSFINNKSRLHVLNADPISNTFELLYDFLYPEYIAKEHKGIIGPIFKLCSILGTCNKISRQDNAIALDQLSTIQAILTTTLKNQLFTSPSKEQATAGELVNDLIVPLQIILKKQQPTFKKG